MKNVIPLTVCLTLVLCLVSCGKNTQEASEKKTDKSQNLTSSEVAFYANRELIRSLYHNDLLNFKKVLIKNPGLDLNQYTDQGETLLTFSIRNDFNEFRDYLIGQKVDLEKANLSSHTPLMASVCKSRPQTLSMLLAAGADPLKKDAKGDTAFHLALKEKKNDLTLIFLRHGVDLNLTDKKGRNATQLAQEYSASAEVLEVLSTLTEVKVDEMNVMTYKKILLAGDIKKFETQIANHPWMAVKYEFVNPLLILTESNQTRGARQIAYNLLNLKLSVEGRPDASITPLNSAATLGKNGLVNLFLNSGANVHAVDAYGRSPLINAVLINRPDIVLQIFHRRALYKYKIKVAGKKEEMNACEISQDLEASFTKDQDKAAAQNIQSILKCRGSSGSGLLHSEYRYQED